MRRWRRCISSSGVTYCCLQRPVTTANLQGIWNKDGAPGGAASTPSTSTSQMNYWPAEVANLSECGMPVYDMIDDLRITGGKVAKDYYNCRGWTLHHNTDLWRGAAPVTASGACGRWVPHGSSDNRGTLPVHPGRKIPARPCLPQMREAAWFSSIISLRLRPEARWPATGYLSVAFARKYLYQARWQPGQVHVRRHDGSDDHSRLVENCLAAGQVLGGKQLILSFVRKFRLRLIDWRRFKSAPRRPVTEWVQDYAEPEPGHRHMSHLYALHPANQITRAGHRN